MKKFEDKKTEKLYNKMSKYYMTTQMLDAYEDELITYKKLLTDLSYCYDWILDGSSDWSSEDRNDVNLKNFAKRYLQKAEVKEELKNIKNLF